MKVKKIAMFFTMIFLIIGFSSSALFACVDVKETSKSKVDFEQQINDALLERGYPQEVLDLLRLSVKKSLYQDPDLVYSNAVVTVCNMEDKIFTEYSVSDFSQMKDRGQISDADLILTWLISLNTADGSLRDVKYSYDWWNIPIFRYQDPIAVSWDGEIYEMVTNSFFKVDMYDAEIKAVSSVPTYVEEGLVHSSENGYASGSSIGVTWYADLKGYSATENVIALYGYGEFTLRRKVSSTGENTVLYGHYVHPMGLNLSATINIDKYGSFTVSCNSSYDERGNQIEFPY